MPYKGKDGKKQGKYKMERQASNIRRRSKPGKAVPKNRYSRK